MFTKLAGADQEIDSEELQDILTASFSKGMYDYWGLYFQIECINVFSRN